MEPSIKRPDLSNEPLIGFDTETHDPDLKTKGSSAFLGSGKIVGFSIATKSGFKEYYNIAHADGTSDEKSKNRKYLEEICALKMPKVGTNLKYDYGWTIYGENISTNGIVYDIQIAEPLLNEYCRGKVSLDYLAGKYLGETKQNETLLNYCEKMGWKTNKRSGGREHLYKMPYSVVRPYGRADADQPIRIWRVQESLLKDQDLWELYLMEARLVPMLLQMKANGTRINEEGLFRLGMKVSDEVYKRKEDLNKKVGFQFNPNSPAQMKKVFDKNGWGYPRNAPTEIMKANGIKEGNPCFDQKSLKKMASEGLSFAEEILHARHLITMQNLFITPWPALMNEGRLRSDFHQLNTDDKGTVSGRFSSSGPNLQQVTSKNEEDQIQIDGFEGQVLRKLFIPEEGQDWLKIDWSQIEYRIMAHYGIGPGSDKIRSRYCQDPNTDYHDEMMKLTGLPDRKVVKTLNFGAAYEMGWRTMSRDYGWEPEYAKNVYTMYHNKVPFIKHTSRRVAKKAEERGYIKTILGRRARLQNRDKSYVMFNRLIQGSAADLMKLAMVQSYEAGIFNTLTPHLTVHDELDCSKPRTTEGDEAARELKKIMENCVRLRVPIIADAEIGENWGTLRNFD